MVKGVDSGKTANGITVDRGVTGACKGTVRKRKKQQNKRLELPSQNIMNLITDYYTRTPVRKMMMNGDEFSDDEEWTGVALSFLEKSTQEVMGKEVTKTDDDDKGDKGEWPEGRDDEEWTEVALSFLEESGCDTPRRVGVTVGDTHKQSSRALQHPRTAVAQEELGTVVNFAEQQEGTPGQDDEDTVCVDDVGEGSSGAMVDVSAEEELAKKVKEMCITTAQNRRAQLRQLYTTLEGEGTDGNFSDGEAILPEEVHGREQGTMGVRVMTMVDTGTVEDEEEPSMKYERPVCETEIEAGVSTATTTPVVVGTAGNFTVEETGQREVDQGCMEDGMGVTMGADMLSMRDDNGIPAAEVEAGAVNERVSVIKNDYTTQSQSHHPSMVKRAEIEGMGDEEVLCVFTDGVCATHGPATKKWRGGKVWGKKKNGLYGWRYDRKD